MTAFTLQISTRTMKYLKCTWREACGHIATYTSRKRQLHDIYGMVDTFNTFKTIGLHLLWKKIAPSHYLKKARCLSTLSIF